MIANIIRSRQKTAIGGGGGIVIDNGDPFYSAVSMLLPMDGTNGSTTFTDSSLNGLTVTSSGVTISDTGARSGFGQFADFPGSSSSASTIPASSLFDFGTGDFTIEFWFNIPAGASGSPYGKTFVSNENNVWSAGAFSLYALASSTQFRPSFWINEFSSSVPILLPSSGDYRDGNWHHLAVVRSGSAFSMYIDGVRVTNGTHAGNCGSSTRNLMIGDNLANNGGDRNLLGKLDDLRISRFARYTSTFTPPTAALPTTASSTPADPYYGYTSLLLHMDGSSGSTNFVDSGPSARTITAVGNAQISTTQSKYGGASAYFDGTGDYLSFTGGMPSGSGTAFTIECWIRLDDLNSYRAISRTGGGLDIGVQPSGMVVCDQTGVGIIADSATGIIAAGNWYHIAVTRDTSNAYKVYVNGTQVASGTNSFSVAAATTIGFSAFSGAHYFKGYIDDFRATNVLRYTSAFTPPAQAHLEYANGNDRHFSNVSLLLHMDGANGSTTFTDNSANALAVTAVGGAQISTTQNQFGGASGYFNGTSGYLSIPTFAGLSFGTDNFTIEGWVYPTSSSGSYGIYATSAGSGTVAKFVVFLDSLYPNCHFYGLTNGNNIYTKATSTVAVNQWSHIAFVRSGTTWTWYINGVASGSGTNSTAITFSTQPTYFGYGGQAAFNYFVGYIDDFRITKGVARTFTAAPTSAFPNA